jgi:hypothetical protein
MRTTPFAALNVLDGAIIAQCKPRYRHQEFPAFLRHIEANVPAEPRQSISEDFTKILTALVIPAFLSLIAASSFAPAFAAPPKWSCSSASAACIKLYAGSPELVAKCQPAGARCMSTGTFVGPKGKRFPGMVRM